MIDKTIKMQKAGTCFDKKAKPKKIGIKIQNMFFSFLICEFYFPIEILDSGFAFEDL